MGRYNLTAGSNLNPGSTFATATFAPGAGRLVLAFAMSRRIGGPALPDDAPIVTDSGYGIYMRPKDYVADDTSCGGENPKQGDGFR